MVGARSMSAVLVSKYIPGFVMLAAKTLASASVKLVHTKKLRVPARLGSVAMYGASSK